MKVRMTLYLCLAALLLSACGTVSGPKTGGAAFAVTPAASKSAIVGTIISVAGSSPKPLPSTIVRLASVFWNEDKTEGNFILEGARSPSTISLEDGTFAFKDLEPGEYVLIVGDVTAEHQILSEPDGKAVIFTAQADQVNNIGDIEVTLANPVN